MESSSLKWNSRVLKLALFATGLAGIVAEYVLSTLATYFLGNAIIQWTMTVSIMLFSMGLGSRISKHFIKNQSRTFIIIEFLLSILSSFSALFVYLIAAYTGYTGVFIYGLCISIGLLIGMEIPLVIMINSQYQSLNVNVSSVLEKDYYGSLAGGVFFAFVGIPFLGMTYTPIVLGAINFLVAVLLLRLMWKELEKGIKTQLMSMAVFTTLLLVSGAINAKPLIIHGEQKRYRDKVIFSEQSKYQKIVITQWKEDYWLYINNNQQLSTLDEKLYHEPLVHPVMSLHPNPVNVLVLGGGDGCAVREILKYPSLESVTVVDLDPMMTELGKGHEILTKLNDNALNNEKVTIENEDGYLYLENTLQYFDVIIVDLPDPKSVDLNRLYTREFYSLAYRKLRPNGLIITQSGSPYFATKAFLCIEKTLQSAEFNTVKLHNQIITLGEWGWIIGSKNLDVPLKRELQQLSFEEIKTEWINNEAMSLMTSFGKKIYTEEIGELEINTIQNPVLYRYYLNGNWDIY